jgi:hypothetical protein
MKHPRAARVKPSKWRDMKFRIRNFMSGRCRMIRFKVALWLRVRSRLRKSNRLDPRWKESWWLLEKSYTKLAKRHCKLELRYLNQKDELRRFRDNGNHRA